MYSTTNTNPTVTLTQPAAVTTTVTLPTITTPPDVRAYLSRMDFEAVSSSSGYVWFRSDVGGYMTWEQAVVYCLVKPWLVEEA
jgi:hypothetical protein